MKKTYSYCLLTSLVVMVGCTNEAANIRLAAKLSTDTSHFVEPAYRTMAPLAKLTDVRAYARLTDTFRLTSPQTVQVYAIGEILYNLSEDDKKYYNEGDNIILTFVTGNGEKYAQQQQLSFSYGDDKKKGVPKGVLFKWKNQNDNQFVSEIKIPWTQLQYPGPPTGQPIGFNIAIGDNDDGLIQKATLIWHTASGKAALVTDHGSLNLDNAPSTGSTATGHLTAYRLTPAVDGLIDSTWLAIPSEPITHLAYGFVKDQYDLSAAMRAAYDDTALYLQVTVNDSRQKKIYVKRLKERNLLTDYGWIENEDGVKVWEMELQHCRHAGGAYRNQKTDTMLRLPAGKYTVRYMADESHHPGNWNEAPPAAPFYGILVFRSRQVPQ